MFGVNSAPEIFQRVFESILAPCKNCLNYLDDIIVFGENESQHNEQLEIVLKTLKDYNVTLNQAKCVFKTTSIQFLGHCLSSNGINPDSEKVRTIIEFRDPETKEETRSFLGLVTYLGKFIPDLATITEPLRRLTKKDYKFNWNRKRHFNFLNKTLQNFQIYFTFIQSYKPD